MGRIAAMEWGEARWDWPMWGTTDMPRNPSNPPACTVIIPTRDRLEKLERCLVSLRGLTPEIAEIVVSVDGPDAGERALVERLGIRALVLDCPPERARGPGAARNRALAHARSDLLLLLNDDVALEPDCLAAHLRAHAARTPDSPAMVLGAAPWVVPQPDRLFDRLIRETSMVFFYDQMVVQPDKPLDPEHDWGFRHAWTLNLSVPTALARAVGGFDESLPAAAFEDLEWAWRVQQKFAAPVLYRPEAVVTHEHQYEPRGYLQREQRLGRDAFALARANPACALEVFGRDVAAAEELDYSRAYVQRERSTVERLEAQFMKLADIPAAAATPELIPVLYGQHLLVKRWHWRMGLLEAAEQTQA